jgi:hypothetical protein
VTSWLRAVPVTRMSPDTVSYHTVVVCRPSDRMPALQQRRQSPTAGCDRI